LPAAGTVAKSIWVVEHGWHVGLAVRRADVRHELWPEAHELRFEHLEVGWGDGDFYPAERGTIGKALRAAVASGSSVVHVAAFDGPVESFFALSRVIELAVSPDGFDEFCRFVAAAYERGGADGRARPVGAGLYGFSRFYRANERYHVLNNSNQWAARALLAAGVPMHPGASVFAGSVMSQVEPLGVVRSAPRSD